MMPWSIPIFFIPKFERLASSQSQVSQSSSGEKALIKMSQPCESSDTKLKILVVDDDATSLSIISALLKSCQHDVLTVKCPYDALATLLVKSFDLVVTDLHMPKMDGLQLQKQIAEKYKLPVIIISADDRESTILKCLMSGVALYMVKPIKPDDLKNLSQYVAASRKRKSIRVEEMGSIQLARSSNDIASASSSVNERISELNDMYPLDNNGSENQGLEDEKLINSLLGDRPF